MALLIFFMFLNMGFGHPILRDQTYNKQENLTSTIVTSPTTLTSESQADTSHRFKSFENLEKGAPRTNSTKKKLSWLRSQVIGGNIEFETPFGQRLLTYADHTASGRCLHCVEDCIIKNILPFYGNCHTSHSYVGQRTTSMVNEATKYVKKCLGGKKDDALIFCGSGATAAIKRLQEVMGVSISPIMRERVLEKLSSEERWVVFVGPNEHHSNILSWRQSLVELVEIGLDKDGLLDVSALKLQLEKYQFTKRPMLGSFSACSNVDGIYTDTRALASLLHQYGAFACFDFASSGPYVEIDMRSGEMDGYDALFLSPHKFVGGPGSPGILLMNKALYQLKASPPSTCGGGTVSFVNCYNEKDTLYIEDIEEREDAGTPPIIQKIRAASAFWIKEYIGCKAINNQEQKYTKRALERLLPNPNIRVLGNTSRKRQAILSFLVYTTKHYPSNDSSKTIQEIEMERLYRWKETGNMRNKPLHGPFVAKLFNDLFGIQARGGCSCAGPYGHRLLNLSEPMSSAIRSAIQKGYSGARPGWTRISFPYYMSNEEFEFILAAVEFTAIYSQRFLPLYHFNWKTGAWTLKKDVSIQNLRVKGNSTELPLTNSWMTWDSEFHEAEEPIVSMTENEGIITKYASYLDTAKQIACLLPKFPSQRPIPNDIDDKFLTFRV